MCCSAANGCGIVKRDWLVNSTYQGTAVVNNTKCNYWYSVKEAISLSLSLFLVMLLTLHSHVIHTRDQQGLQKNLWYQTVDKGIPALLDQQVLINSLELGSWVEHGDALLTTQLSTA
jgi:uncharacterized protein YbaR (Trm112 family)